MSEKPSPFSYVLSADKTKLLIELHPAVFEYSADEVAGLLEFFATIRSKMTPTVPDSPANARAIAADRYEVLQNPQDGTAQIYLKIPGLVWAYVHLERHQCEAMAETLVPPLSPPGAAKH